MNNLFLTGLIASAGAVLWLGQHASSHNNRTNVRNLSAEIVASRTALAQVNEATTSVQADLASRQAELKPAQAERDTSANDERTEFPKPPLDPENEGAWPAGKPYFYLSKKHLGKIGYRPFDQQRRLTPAAESLFGMSIRERDAVNDASLAFYARAKELQSANATRVTPAPGVNTDTHREVSFSFPPATNELTDLREGLAAAVRDALGSARADLLLAKANQELEQAFAPYVGRAFTMTYYADRKADGTIFHQIRKDVPGVGTMFLPVYFPLTPDSPLAQYRHLFGEEPLIPLPTSTRQDK